MSLDAESDILSPLPQTLHRGLTAVAVLAFLSFSSCALAFIYLTYKLIRWHIKSFRKEANESESQTVDLALGLAERHFGGQDGNTARCKRRRRHPNQFLVLIYNLLLADMHQATAFMLNSVWVSSNSITVGTPTCFVQGLMVSNGDLASSCFITAIAVHTYLTCVRGYKPPQWALYVTIVGLWIFVYGITFVGLAVTDFGQPVGGYYVRAAAWCWINIKYENLRLLTHYLFIFISLVLTGALYTAVFLSLRQRKRSESPQDRITPLPTSQNPKTSTDTRAVRPGAGTIESHTEADAHSGGSHPAFLVYPVIYIVCTAPLALGRVATMAGANVPLGYFCAAGALITSNGWLDVLLWGFTRRALLFNADVDTEESGLETFTFMRTPHGRKYGNMVWVEGAGRRREADEETPAAKDNWGLGWVRERMGWRRLGLGAIGGSASGHRRTGTRSISQETLRGAAAPGEMSIQMDMVTTVVVEIDAGKQGSTAHNKVPSRTPSRAPSRTPSRTPSTYSVSMHSSEKDNALRY